MKKFRIILTMGLIAVFSSCGVTKTSTTTTDNQSTNRGRANTEVGTTKNTTTGSRATTSETISTARTANATATATTAAAEEAEKARLQDMYIAVIMSDTQIAQFEREWESELNTWKRNNRNQTMNNFVYTEYQDRILKDILSAGQFKKYQQWARKNPVSRGN